MFHENPKEVITGKGIFSINFNSIEDLEYRLKRLKRLHERQLNKWKDELVAKEIPFYEISTGVAIDVGLLTQEQIDFVLNHSRDSILSQLQNSSCPSTN